MFTFEHAELSDLVGNPKDSSEESDSRFYIPRFDIYQDAISIRTIDWVWFIPTKTGSYQLACSELCGSGHYNMKAQIEVVSQAERDKWYKEKVVAAVNASSGNPDGAK
jgi:cytochrome c oxidase subunit 2